MTPRSNTGAGNPGPRPGTAPGRPAGAPTRRRPSPAVYRRRRLVAGIIALLLVAALVAGGIVIAGMFGAGTTEGATGQASQQQGAKPDPKPTPASNDESSNDESSAKDDDGASAGTDDDSAAGQNDNAAKDSDGSKAQEDDNTADDNTADDDASDNEAADAAASDSGTETGTGSTCDESSIAVTASTDKTVYTAEEKPVLTLTVSNEGETECSINLGTSEMEFLITSGEDRIFSSADCQVDGTDNYQTLEPGQSEKANFIWDRNRTAPGCDPVEANPMPGTYILVTKLDEWTSEETIFKLN